MQLCQEEYLEEASIVIIGLFLNMESGINVTPSGDLLRVSSCKRAEQEHLGYPGASETGGIHSRPAGIRGIEFSKY